MRRVLCAVLVLLVLLVVSVLSYRAGVSHAVRVAVPSICDDGFLIDFDGDMHLYR